MQLFFTLTLAAYCFLVHFGNAFRFGSGEGGLGLPTALAVLLLISGFFQIPKQIRHTPILFAISLLFGWVALSSVLAAAGLGAAYSALAKQVLYLCIAASVASWRFDDKRLRFVTLSIAVGLSLSSGLTIVDHMGWANVPFCNVNIKGSEIEGQAAHIIQAGGFFARRTAMAAFFSLSITFVAILALASKSWLAKLFYAGAAVTGMVAILLTHNRSAIVAIAGGLTAYVLFSNLLTVARRIQVLILGALLGIGVLVIMATYFPQHFAVYQEKFAPFLSNSRAEITEGDNVRFKHAEYVFDSLFTNPLGNGLTKLPLRDEGFGTHNQYITWIWAGGFFTLIWLIPFAISVWKTLYKKVPVSPSFVPYVDAFRFAILAFLAHNMVHESFGTGLFWVMLAVVISVRHHESHQAVALQWQRFYGPSMARPISPTYE